MSAKELLKKYQAGNCTETEKEWIAKWFSQYRVLDSSGLSEEQLFQAEAEMWEYIQEQKGFEEQGCHKIGEEPLDIGTIKADIFETDVKVKKPFLHGWRRIAAAIAFLVLSIGGYISVGNYLNDKRETEQMQLISEIEIGGNRATLTFSDGSTVDLNDDQTGIIVSDKDIKYADGSFVIQSDSEGSLPTRQGDKKANPLNKEPVMLALTTPVGGQYQVTLPDGTKVWLNAATTLKYPSHFNGKDRRVEIEGEAYFEVNQVSGNRHEVSGKKRNAKLPFIVVSKGQEVTVLGTHFNIKTYNNEKETITTLLEGSVSVAALSSSTNLSSRGTKDLYNPSSQTTILTPGQQSTITNNTIKVTKANLETTLAWKSGKFKFHETELRDVMNQLSQWYNVEIVYQGNISKTYFYGEIARDNPISDVLEMLKRSGLKFTVEKEEENYKLIVIP